jgi:hypothetical protein
MREDGSPKTGAAYFPKLSVPSYKTALCYNPETQNNESNMWLLFEYSPKHELIYTAHLQRSVCSPIIPVILFKSASMRDRSALQDFPSLTAWLVCWSAFRHLLALGAVLPQCREAHSSSPPRLSVSLCVACSWCPCPLSEAPASDFSNIYAPEEICPTSTEKRPRWYAVYRTALHVMVKGGLLDASGFCCLSKPTLRMCTWPSLRVWNGLVRSASVKCDRTRWIDGTNDGPWYLEE